MQQIKLIPPDSQLNASVEIPGSKSYTNRALIMASLAEGVSEITGYSESEDSEVLTEALRAVGVEISQNAQSIKVAGNAGNLEVPTATIDLKAAGTSMRFFTAVAALIKGEVILDGTERMRERPINELVDALHELGVSAQYLLKKNCPPIKIKGGNISKNEVAMHGDYSSQYFSALMMIAPVLENGLKINVKGEQISKSYIDMTINSLEKFGVNVQNRDYKQYIIEPTQNYKNTKYHVEGDASGASYFWAVAALNAGKVRVTNLNPDSAQGDIKFPQLLEKMGCNVQVNRSEGWIEVTGTNQLKAIEADMELMPDTAQTLAVVAAFASGKSIIKGLSTLKIKETDRIEATKIELAKIGIKAEAGSDYLVIHGGKPKTAEIDTYKDHRMAMAFAAAATRLPGLCINDPEVVKKSFPDFWQKLIDLGFTISDSDAAASKN